jgi:UDP-N-acetylmuramoyl-L-alanyl-D-glutamate--2,6-diaminopimelate ligase
MADCFFGHPSENMQLFGITGTNGKTTVAFLLESIMGHAGREVGLMGTMLYRWKEHEEDAARTTPDSIDMHRMLAKMRDNGINIVVMEVSSHALSLDRVFGMSFDATVFTNLSRDHLDFHSSFEEYRSAKAKLFGMLSSKGCGVINIDDPAAQWMLDAASGRTVTFGERAANADYRIGDLNIDKDISKFILSATNKNYAFSTRLRGRFNVTNCAAAAIVGLEMGLSEETIRKGILDVDSVRGRMETFDSKKGFSVVVDYAHTPSALENVLKTAREFTRRRLLVVFGCGGDRDRGKRPGMGQIAANLADVIYITSDNPRREDPQAIINDILEGIGSRNHVTAIVERKEAIQRALDEAGSGDTVLIAGKGHETYQEIGRERTPFDDRAVAEEYLKLK